MPAAFPLLCLQISATKSRAYPEAPDPWAGLPWNVPETRQTESDAGPEGRPGLTGFCEAAGQSLPGVRQLFTSLTDVLWVPFLQAA